MNKLTAFWGDGKLRIIKEDLDLLDAQFITRGSHVVTAGEASANAAVIATGDSSFSNFMVQIYRSGVNVASDAIITSGSGNLTVSDGASTYNMAAGDVINWIVF